MLRGTQAEYARHIGRSRQYVSKLVSQGKIPTGGDGKIVFAEADRALRRNADPARALAKANQAAPESDGSLFDQAGGTAEQTAGETAGAGPNYQRERARREQYQADLAELELQEKLGRLIPRADVENAMVENGKSIGRALDRIERLAEELVAITTDGGGVAEVRGFLRERVRGLRQEIADSLSRVAAKAEAGDDEDDGGDRGDDAAPQDPLTQRRSELRAEGHEQASVQD